MIMEIRSLFIEIKCITVKFITCKSSVNSSIRKTYDMALKNIFGQLLAPVFICSKKAGP